MGEFSGSAVTYVQYSTVLLFHCSWAQSCPLPVSHFRWLQPEEISRLNILEMDDTQTEGYFFEVDLIYSKEIQEKTMSFPLAPLHLTIDDTMLSPYARGKKHVLSVAGFEPATASADLSLNQAS